MSIPATYDDATFAMFLRDGVLRATAGELKWTNVQDTTYSEMVDAVCEAMGITSIAEATDIALVRAWGRVKAWEAAAAETVRWFDTGERGREIVVEQKREQIHRHCLAKQKDAQLALDALLTARHTATTNLDTAAIRTRSVTTRSW